MAGKKTEITESMFYDKYYVIKKSEWTIFRVRSTLR